MLLEFPEALATLSFVTEPKVAIFKSIRIETGHGQSPYTLFADTAEGVQGRVFGLASIDQVAPNYWEAKSHPGEVAMTIKPTTEYDVVNSITASSDLPLPLDVIASILEPVHMEPVLYAMSEDDGFVATMMLSSDAGMYMRYSGQWHDLNPEVVDGLTVTEVDGNALDMFDQFDRAGQLVHVGAMPTSINEVPVAVSIDSGTTSTNPAVTAAGVAELLEVPTLNSADDVEAAVAAASEEPGIRWWVERRLKALGIETDIPWSED